MALSEGTKIGPYEVVGLIDQGGMGDTRCLDELFVKIQGRLQYLWRAVDEDGDVLDILVQSRRNRRAARRLFRKLLKRRATSLDD